VPEDVVALGQVDQWFPRVAQMGAHVPRAELEVSTAQGPKMLGVTVTPLSGQSGHLLVVFQDLTRLRRMEGELKRVDRLASLGTLSAQLAHEIRNPLASMRGSAQMLAGAEDVSASSSRLAGILVRESDRLSALVEDFLRFARPPPPTLAPTSLKAIAAETLEMLSSDPLARGVKVETQLREVIAQLDGDQLRQVLLNLLRNAFAAVSAGGTVRVSTEARDGRAILKVWDSAGALAPDDQARIFEPFFSKRSGGTGLGLSMAHSIVHAHGGSIQVASSLAQGTEFAVEIPLSKEVAVANSGR